MSEVNDSSDDDVCFGPYTIKEAKKDWRKYVGKKVDRRHSTASVLKQLKIPNSDIPGFLKQVEEISISTSNYKCSSEYLTPNETVSSEISSQNSDFLEKLRQVIHEPSQASSYATALDRTSNQYQGSANTTNLDSIYVTLVKDTRCFLDSENDVYENGEETNEYSKEMNENSVITINDESQSLSESFCAEELKKSLDVSSSSPMLSEEYNYEEPVCVTSNLHFSTNENEANQSSLGITSLNLSDSGDTEPKTRDYSCMLILEDSLKSIEESYCLQYDTFNNSPKTKTSLPVQEPTKNDAFHQFDDTLEEITNFLAQGEDYVMPEVTHSKYTPNLKQSDSKIRPPSAVSGRLFTKPSDKQAEDFKVPIKPLKKITTPSKLNTNPSLKNVVSPVGVYIKNSPKYCPLRKPNKVNNTPQTNTLKVDKTPMKENFSSTSNIELPMVIYRPAKNKHIINDEPLKLPENIKKLVGAQSIIKHEERIQVADFNESIERRLMESDFSIDASCINDVSILTNKQPFKT